MAIDPEYINTIRERVKRNKIYKSYQMTGLMLAEILNDNDHKSLYMKLAKKHSEQKLLELAKDISQRKNIKNMGAYFMKMLSMEKDIT